MEITFLKDVTDNLPAILSMRTADDVDLQRVRDATYFHVQLSEFA
jgi:hypothetical protein